MRLSKREAESEAVRIAEEFVASQGVQEWTCGGARPDPFASGSRRRKDVVKWSVLFHRSTLDGPVIVRVDLDAREATFP